MSICSKCWRREANKKVFRQLPYLCRSCAYILEGEIAFLEAHGISVTSGSGEGRIGGFLGGKENIADVDTGEVVKTA